MTLVIDSQSAAEAALQRSSENQPSGNVDDEIIDSYRERLARVAAAVHSPVPSTCPYSLLDLIVSS